MTIPPGMRGTVRKVSDMVREMWPRAVTSTTKDERMAAVYLRGNDNLMEALRGIIQSRIGGRANVAEPSDPVQCKAMMARDRELQWLLGRLEFIYHMPIDEAATTDEREQPA